MKNSLNSSPVRLWMTYSGSHVTQVRHGPAMTLKGVAKDMGRVIGKNRRVANRCACSCGSLQPRGNVSLDVEDPR
jgi:predicted RNA-binding protein YlqC (UPF0109 family)